jgi:hypothetical protein
MRLQLEVVSNVHKDLVSALGWNAHDELYTCSDDKTAARWDVNGDAGGKVRAASSSSRASPAPRRRTPRVFVPRGRAAIDPVPPSGQRPTERAASSATSNDSKPGGTDLLPTTLPTIVTFSPLPSGARAVV